MSEHTQISWTLILPNAHLLKKNIGKQLEILTFL